jgi:sulfite dehydrogenase
MTMRERAERTMRAGRGRGEKREGRVKTALLALAVASAITVPLSIAARAQVRTITLPAETAVYRPSKLPGYQLAQGQCSSCHSADYVLYQPASPRAYWQATVDKMVKAFGAPIPADQIPPIVDYLVATYGTDAAATPAKTPAPAATPKPSPKD